MRKAGTLFVFLFLFSELFCCTIGVINGSVTADGRPIIWKSREAGTNVQMSYEDSYTYKYIGSGSGGSEYIWMGMNEAGLAIANAQVSDLDRLPGNGDCMLQALRNYTTVAEFLTFLDSTNVTGRETHTNYVMIDATGAAVVLEVSNNEYWVYDTVDTEYGFIVRNNFSIAGGGTTSTKYALMNNVLAEMAGEGDIEWQEIFPAIIRGFYDEEQNPLAVPFADRWSISDHFGYLYTGSSNNGISNTSVSLMHGAAPGEPAWLSTMWTILGTPTCGIALPYWAVCPAIPAPASSDPSVPLTNRALQVRQEIFNTTSSNWADSYILSNEENTGYWDTILPFEQEKMELISNLREQWVNEPPSINELQNYETSICEEGYSLVMDWEAEYDYEPHYECEPANGEVPLTVHFNDLSLHAPDSLGWDFDADGVIDSMLTTELGIGADYEYIEPGTYSPVFYVWRDTLEYCVQAEELITVEYPDVDYLAASLDTVICDFDEPLNEEITIYNIGEYPVTLNEISFTTLDGYPHPEPELFFWDFIDGQHLPLEIAVGDSCRLDIMPVMPVREYWGETLVIAGDLDTLAVPCLYDEELWHNGDEEEDVVEPDKFTISIYPNPFNPTAHIMYNIPQSGLVDLSVYNLKGQKVKALVNKQMNKCNASLTWDGKNEQDENCGSGIYLIMLALDGKVEMLKRCVLLK